METHLASLGSSLGLYRISDPLGPLSCSSGVSLGPNRFPSGPIHSLDGASWSALSRASWSGLTFSATLTAPEAKTSRPMTPRSEMIFRASELVMNRVTRVRRWAAADCQLSFLNYSGKTYPGQHPSWRHPCQQARHQTAWPWMGRQCKSRRRRSGRARRRSSRQPSFA
jgi:hypothetical protein